MYTNITVVYRAQVFTISVSMRRAPCLLGLLTLACAAWSVAGVRKLGVRKLDFRKVENLHPTVLAIVQPALQWVKENEPFTRNRDLVEVFAGEREITKAAQRLKLNCIAYDKRYKPCTHNILHPKGFHNALRLVCELRPFGTLWTAPVCSTWIFIRRCGTDRSAWNPSGKLSN